MYTRFTGRARNDVIRITEICWTVTDLRRLEVRFFSVDFMVVTYRFVCLCVRGVFVCLIAPLGLCARF